MLWKLQHFSAHLHRFDCCQHAKTEFDLQPRQNAFCLIECVRAVRVCACVWATGGVIEWVQASVIYIQLTVVCAHRTAIYLICTSICILGSLEIQMLALDVMTLLWCRINIHRNRIIYTRWEVAIMKQGIQCSTGAAEAAQINVYYGIMEIKQGEETRREMKLNIYPTIYTTIMQQIILIHTICSYICCLSFLLCCV